MKRVLGFTMIELAVAVAVMAILVAFSVPPLLTSLSNSAANSLGNTLVTSLNLARSEAVKRGASVSLCPAADSTLSSCGSTQSWTNGWIVFVDVNANGVYNAGNDTILRTGTLPNGTTLTGAFNSVTFNSAGFVSNTAALVFTVQAPGCANNNAVSITIRNPGEIISAPIACN